MQHVTVKAGDVFNDNLTMACGNSKGRRELGRKGVPKILVPRSKDGDNIDLFPEGYLWERGCTIVMGDVHELTTPKGRVLRGNMLGILTYIAKDELNPVV